MLSALSKSAEGGAVLNELSRQLEEKGDAPIVSKSVAFVVLCLSGRCRIATRCRAYHHHQPGKSTQWPLVNRSSMLIAPTVTTQTATRVATNKIRIK